MKAVILSDTHGQLDGARAVLTAFAEANTVFFLGDLVEDGKKLQEEFPQKKFYLVCGNNDWGQPAPMEQDVLWGGRKFSLTHGHPFHLHSGLLRLSLWGRQRAADVVLFGHTHCPCLEREGTLLFCNPGSISEPRSSKEPTFAVAEVEQGELTITCYTLWEDSQGEKNFTLFARAKG